MIRSRRVVPHNTRADTRNRIIDCALSLFNERGIGSVSTNRIATELNMSSGNLHYHFKSKEQIAEWLIRRFDERLESIAESSLSVVALDDLWLLLHFTFEAIQDYRFVYCDVDYLMREAPKIGARVGNITARQIKAVTTMCRRLAAASIIQSDQADIDSLALQIVFTTTCWLTFVRLLPQSSESPLDSGRAAYQVLTLLYPYLETKSQMYLLFLRNKYVETT